MRHVTEYSPAKTGEYPRIFPNFQNFARCENDLKDNKDNSRHLGQKYAQIFVLGHYLFLVAHSFPRASLSENCSLLGTDNREFTKPRRRRRGQRRVKNEFIFYLRISRYSKVIYFVYHCQNYLKTQCETQR